MVDEQKQSYRERWGVLATWQSAVFYRLRHWLGLRIYGIYARPLALAAGPDPVMPGFSLRLFDNRDADQLVALAGSPDLELPEPLVRGALAKGDVCEAILCGDELVSYCWSAFTPTHDEEGVYVGFGPSFRYGYKSFTLPEFRGLHLLRTFTPIRDRYCVTNRGRTHTIAFIALENRSSIRAAQATGYERVGIAGYLRRGSIFWPFGTCGARTRGFRFFLPDQRV